MAFRLKETSAGLAVNTGMDRGLAIMFVKSMITLEYSAASTTIIMTGLIMFLEVIFVCEVFITILAIVMARALNTMLFQTSPGVKVDVAFIADIMYWRVSLMLIKSTKVYEVAATAVAVSHFGVSSWLNSIIRPTKYCVTKTYSEKNT
jgi:hypothetical protein